MWVLNRPAEVEGVAEAGLLALLGGQRLDRLEVEVVVQVQVVEVLAMDQQVQHVVPLPTHLQGTTGLVWTLNPASQEKPFLFSLG